MTAFFFDLPIVGILRGFGPAELEPILSTVLRGGLKNIEITMNSPNAAMQIRTAIQQCGNRMAVGAGTVTSLALLQEALAAGAKFIVTPTLQVEIVNECVRAGVPVFPGAFSPTEVFRAAELGATMVKLFPAEIAGPVYVKALRGPFPNLKIMPTGGVDRETLPEFLKAGASGAGVGSPLFRKERIQAGDWDWLEAETRGYVQCWRTFSAR
jgi:2-dehydro-3-deoxyphosphogluconate aldolase / (4S)-4-hydroxy-2-oxoglutarate aldolase